MGASRKTLAALLLVMLVFANLTATPALAAPAQAQAATAQSRLAQRPGPGLWDRIRGLLGAARVVLGSNDDRREEQSRTAVAGERAQLPAGVQLQPAKRVRELTDQRTANRKLYQLADGRVQAEVSATPTHYRSGDGWRDIDTRVGAAGRPGFAYGNSSNTFTSLFGASSDRLMRFELGDRHLELGLPGQARKLAPRADGSTVTYQGAAGGADLVYEVTATAAKERIVLRRAPAGDAVYSFTLRTGGVEAVERPDGSIAFVRPDTRTVLFTMPRPFMYDDRDDPESPNGKAWSRAVTQRVERHGATTTIIVTADGAWLRAPERRYPVVVDPTIKIQPAVSQAQDVMLAGDDPNGNYDGTWRLSVGTTSAAPYRALVQFPLTGVPTNTRLDSAQLQLYYDQTFTTFANNVQIEARRVTAPWTESTATWAGMNAKFAEQGANVEQVDDGDAGKTSVTGAWPYSTNATLTPLAINGDYRFNKDTVLGDTHTWVPRLTESGDYAVQAHYVPATDRTTVPYTVHYNGGTATVNVNQAAGTTGTWASLGTKPFLAGTTHKVVLRDATDTTKAAIADAVRFTKAGVDTKRAAISSVWNSFSVRNIVQSWLDGTQPNYGFMVKAVNEATLGQGGPRYEAAEYFYGGESDNTPKLILTWGRPGVTLSPPTTVTATGANLSWSAYADPSSATGDDILEYQVHRSVNQSFTPSAATLIAPVKPTIRTYADTTAVPTPADSTALGNAYYYMVAVKTKDGQLIPAATQLVRLPKAGRVVRIFQGSAIDTTLAAAQPDANVNVYDGDPYVGVGNNSTLYGDTRGVVKFPSLTGIPTGARVLDAQFQMWAVTTIGATTGLLDVHALTRSFDEATATWNRANSTTLWTRPGGDFNATAASSVTGVTNDPEWQSWTTTGVVQGWLTTPSTNHGLLVKMRDEVASSQRSMLLSGEAAEKLLQPKLVVTYLEKTSESTYHAPYTPARMIPGDEYPVDVTLTNTTTTTWPAASRVLSYRWTLPDGTDVTTGGNQIETALPQDVSPGEVVTVHARVRTPIQSGQGNKREAFVLNWDLRDTTTGQFLSQSDGIPPLSQNVTVEDPTSDLLGLEQFYQYSGKNTGSGTSALANLYDGNVVWGYNPISNPSRGVATFVRMTYNSKDTSASAMGFGWSLAASSMHRLGTPLDLHPPGQDYPTTVTLTDGDGTAHFFELNKHGSTDPAVWDYDHPAGVHLYLQKNVGGDESRAWVMTRPDRTRFYFDDEGYHSATVDKNGNTLELTYEERRSNNKPTKFLQYVTDPDNRRTLTLDYYAKGEAYSFYDDAGQKVAGTNLTNPKIIDQVQAVTDVSGRRIELVYTDKGLLAELTDGAGDAAAKVFKFVYDADEANKNTKLVRVTDPRGNSTNLAYFEAPVDPKFKWSLQTLTDRLGHPTGYQYVDPDGQAGSDILATVTDPEQHATVYRLDGFARTTQTTNAKNELTRLAWDADNNVTRMEEANGAFSTWAYDPKTGYPLEVRDAQATADGTPGTTLTYQTALNGFIADVVAKRSPEGRTWNFGYDAFGNLTSVTDPKGVATTAVPDDYVTRYAYDALGQLSTATDANEHVTRYTDYDPSGFPTKVVDALDHPTDYVYDARGQVTDVTDAKGKRITQTYDLFGRPLENKAPIDQDANQFVITPAPDYDSNDNITRDTAPNGAVTTSVFDAADRLKEVSAPKDEPADPARLTTADYDNVGNLTALTEPKGNLTPTDPDDFTTRFAYNELYQRTSVTNANGETITYEYDNVNNLIKTVDPAKSLSADPADFTTRYTYDRAHRLRTETDAAGNVTSYGLDRDGLLRSMTDREGNTTELVIDERGKLVEQRAPHRSDAGTITHRVTRLEYDEVGNQTRVITPRGVATTDDPDDFVQQTVYDPLNRVAEEIHPFDRDDPQYNTPTKTTYEYDEVGNRTRVSAPPSHGQAVRIDTTYTHFDNGWVRTSTDPWDIVTAYTYNELGLQTGATVTSAGESSASRSQVWSYYPDGKLRARSDEGVPVGRNVVLVDNSDTQHITAVGAWPASSAGTAGRDFQGFDYRTHASGSGGASFSWGLTIPADGTYEVFVRYAQGTATNAPYRVDHAGGSTTRLVDQTQRAGQWVSLGSFAFTEASTGHQLALTDNANGTVVADAVKLVRDNAGEVDTERKSFEQRYDPNGNLVQVKDLSPSPRVGVFQIAYDGINRVQSVEERQGTSTLNTTSYTYDANSNPKTRTHDDEHAVYEYDARDLVTKVTNGANPTDPQAKVTTFTYTPREFIRRQVQGNNNAIDYDYFLDGLLRHQVQKKSNGTLVAEHTLEYTLNGHRAKDTSKVMNADNHAAYIDEVREFTYDPRDRVTRVTKKDASSGTVKETETYRHDANNNVIEQTVGGTSTSFTYDRNRLQFATAGGATSTYNYDPFGRLDTVTLAGIRLEKYVYDGFDRVTEHRTPAERTRYTYDPMDRTASRTKKAGTAEEKKTDFNYLGISEDVLSEEIAGQIQKSYRYGPFGERLAQIKTKEGGGKELSYYGYNPHSDVEVITDENGDTRSTYGYTAYGENDTESFTGVDQPTGNPGGGQQAEPYNAYRFNANRWDQASGDYDMGFRDYDPGLNRFLTRDLYNGALADLRLASDPFANNRYAFAGGNPISRIEIDGHWSFSDIGHAVLDVAGLVPVIGEAADVVNGVWYAAEGDWVNAGLSLASAIPFAGYAATATKYGLKYGDEAFALANKTDNFLPARTPDAPNVPKVDAPAPTRAADATPPKPDGPAPGAKPADPVNPPTRPRGCNSFTPTTPVLMADGTHKPIQDVKVGDRVLAVNPGTGAPQGRPVIATVTGDGGKDLVEVTVDTDGAYGTATGTVTATSGHAFWVDDDGRWVDAEDLRAGDTILTPTGGRLPVVRTRAYAATRRVHNLTVAGIHTYFVSAGGKDLLVHNDTCPINYGKELPGGQRSGVTARLTPDMVNTGTKANPNIEPPGWGGGAAGHARGHLLGRQLGGSGDEPLNLVTMFQNPANSPVMRGWENKIRKALENGETIDFSATPIYKGSDPIPIAITLRAQGSGGFDLWVSILNKGK